MDATFIFFLLFSRSLKNIEQMYGRVESEGQSRDMRHKREDIVWTKGSFLYLGDRYKENTNLSQVLGAGVCVITK